MGYVTIARKKIRIEYQMDEPTMVARDGGFHISRSFVRKVYVLGESWSIIA